MDQNSFLTVWALFVVLFQSVSSVSVRHDDSIKKALIKRDSHYLEKIKEFKYIVSGFDYEDRPVIIMNWGKKLDKFLPPGSNYTTTNQYVTIKNFDGFDLRTIYKPAAVKIQLRLLSDVQGVIDRLAYGVIINANPVNPEEQVKKVLSGNEINYPRSGLLSLVWTLDANSFVAVE
ncbi:unnamed protein product [Allacma fusca]|uniref:Uncharacterized protein n=1 Tax=Allacma fusca TaxID=39272 RepID=A0A8J2JDD2_9HEXA|nr:unnamed protein product [Allacma fusca]